MNVAMILVSTGLVPVKASYSINSVSNMIQSYIFFLKSHTKIHAYWCIDPVYLLTISQSDCFI